MLDIGPRTGSRWPRTVRAFYRISGARSSSRAGSARLCGHSCGRRRGLVDSATSAHLTHAADPLAAVTEETKHAPARPRSARCEQARASFSPELVTNILIRLPCLFARSGRSQTDTFKARRCREVGHPDVDLPEPDPARQLLVRRNALLGEVAVPLRPGGLFRIREIEGAEDIAALPPTVGRRHADRWPSRPRVVWSVPHPAADDRRAIDIERHGLDGPGIFQLADQRGHASVLTPPDQVDRLLVA
jgi:hypothetical protein